MSNTQNPDMSLMFYHYLCHVIGTENVVRRRRQIFIARDNVNSGKYISVISSGSKAEGLDIEGSDFDVMLLHNYQPVYEHDNKVKYFPETYPVVMDTSDCKPGFTQLKSQLKIPIYKYYEYKAGDWYISSQLFRDTRKDIYPHLITHGPCISTADEQNDLARCLRCSDWISQAQPWLLRAQNVRLNNEVINKIIEFGVLFVPVGCKNSPNIHLEWRISFSFAEKLLIWSFNHVQLLCYALLKILLKEVIKHTTDDLLCSYFMKTVMLWICEETNASQWEANNIISCFMSCLKRLTYCVEFKTCMHYFITDNDLFENRFNTQQHKLLLSTLKQLQNSGWTCLLQTKTLRSFRSYLESPLSHAIFRSSYLQCLFYLYVVKFNLQHHCVYFCLHSKTKDFFIYKLSENNFRIAQGLDIRSNVLIGNKHRYSIHRKGLCHALIGLNHDSVSGWLMLASFFYVRQQYKICKCIINNCLLKCTPDKCLLAGNLPKGIQTRFESLQTTLGIRPISLFKKFVINLIDFTPSSQFLPEEMNILRNGKTLAFPPIVFGLFLKCLCDYHLGNHREQIDALCNLKSTIASKNLVINDDQLKRSHMLMSIACSFTNESTLKLYYATGKLK